MKRQARKIVTWGKNVYVRIPITNSHGETSIPLIKELAAEGAQLNVTAILTLEQVRSVAAALNRNVSSIVSVFAGRIADTGIDPMPTMRTSREILENLPKAELLWASVREVFKILQAEECGCHIVTMQHDILAKAAKVARHGSDRIVARHRKNVSRRTPAKRAIVFEISLSDLF
jgi:transaldolase